MEAAATLGHNKPPSPLDELRERLARDAASLIARRDELLAGADRAPAIIGDDDAAGKTGDLIKLLAACHKNAEKLRVDAKEPHLEAGRAVDGWFKRITDPLAATKAALQKRLDAYLTAKAMAAQRALAAEAEAARARARALEEAALAAERAAKASAPAAPILEAAVVAEKAAAVAERAAEAAPSELSKTRGDYGSLAQLRTAWVGEIVDRATLDLEALRQHIPLDALEQAVRAFVRAGGRELAGAKIYEKTTAVVR